MGKILLRIWKNVWKKIADQCTEKLKSGYLLSSPAITLIFARTLHLTLDSISFAGKHYLLFAWGGGEGGEGVEEFKKLWGK